MADVEQIPRQIRFRGPPTDLTAALEEPVAGRAELTVTVPSRDEEQEPLEATAAREAEGHVLRLSLPPRTPPGSYEASVAVNGKESPVGIQVEPAPDVRSVPESLYVEAGPGSEVSVDLSLVNLGNVPVSVRGTQAVGVFLSGGIERALRAAYVERIEGEQRRVDVFAEALSDSHGGLVKMSFAGGDVDVAPGECRPMTGKVKIPSGLERGRVYTGTWALEDLVLPVRIVVPAESDDG